MTPTAWLMRYHPAPTETFVLDEVLRAFQSHGLRPQLYVLDPGRGPAHTRHAPLDPIRRFVPRPSDPRAMLAALVLPVPPSLAARLSPATRPRDLRRVSWLASRLEASGVGRLRLHFAAETARLGLAAAALARVPSTLVVHARDLYVPEPDLDWMLAEADRVETISEHQRGLLVGLGVPEAKVSVIRLPAWPPHRPADPCSLEGPLRLLSVGRLVPKKGHDLLLRALAALGGQPVQWTIVGDGPLRPAIHRLQQELARPGFDVELRGALSAEDLADLRATGRFHGEALACRVAPDGDRDGLPVSLLEARAWSRPIVTSALPGFDEAFGKDPGATLVPLVGPEPSIPLLTDALAALRT